MRENTREFWNGKWKDDGVRYDDSHEQLYQWTRPHLKGVVADIGCGSAGVSDKLDENRVSKYIGIDYSDFVIEQNIAKAGKWSNNKIERSFHVGDARNLSMIETKSVDTVLISQVIEHFYDFDPILIEAQRIAKNWIVVTVPYNAPDIYHVWPRWTAGRLGDIMEPYADAIQIKRLKNKYVLYEGEVRSNSKS